MTCESGYWKTEWRCAQELLVRTYRKKERKCDPQHIGLVGSRRLDHRAKGGGGERGGERAEGVNGAKGVKGRNILKSTMSNDIITYNITYDTTALWAMISKCPNAALLPDILKSTISHGIITINNI